MNILITGASGFVGRYLCAELFKQKLEVLGVVRSVKVNIDNTQKVVVCSIGEKTDWSKVVFNIQVVIHLAARVHVMDDQSNNPLQAFLDVNFYGTLNLAKQAAAAGVKRFVYVSSIGVNGLQTTEGQAFSEKSVVAPHNDYSQSKLLAEVALKDIGLSSGMEIVILRPPLVYGPNPKGNFETLLNVVIKKIPLPLASIQNKRSFIYLGNLVDAIITCATNTKAANQLYLVSDIELVSTPQFISKLAQALGKRCLFFPFPIFMMRFLAKFFGKSAAVDRLTQSLVIDSRKIRKELDWTPPFTMAQGIEATAEWFRSQQ